MAASHTCFKLLLLYLHLIAFFEKAGSLKYGPKICARSEACFDTFWGSTRKDGLDYEGFCWFYSQNRGSRRHVGFGAGRAFCITPERKSNTWLFLSLLLLSGDICPNPGPRNILDPCGICKKPVKSSQRGICCDLCNGLCNCQKHQNYLVTSFQHHVIHDKLIYLFTEVVQTTRVETEK